jgi:hypothetical protein
MFEEALFESDPFADGEFQAGVYVPTALDRMNSAPSFFLTQFEEAFSDVEALVTQYGPVAVAEGVDTILNGSKSDLARVFTSNEFAISRRCEAVALLEKVIDDLFVPHCDPVLIHASRLTTNRVNHVCYMMWDVTHLTSTGGDLWQSVRHVMNHALQSSNVAVIEGGLHGLGHSVYQHPEAAQDIKRFRRDRPSLPAALANYARWAQTGQIQ